MRVAIHQPNFLPWRGYFEKARAADLFILLDDVQFSKGSYTNRTMTRNGWLTVPVHAHGKPLIMDVVIAEDFTDPLFGHKAIGDDTLLSHFNGRLIWRAAIELGITGNKFRYASMLREKATDGPAGLLELCRLVGATEYLCGPSGVKYGVPEAFAGSGIEVVPFEWKPKTELDKLSIMESLR